MKLFRLFPRTRREWLGSLVRAAVALAVILGLGLAFALWMRRAPGTSWKGPLPELTPNQREISARLRGHVVMLADTIGPRSLGQPHQLEAAARYVERGFADAGLTTSAQVYRCYGLRVRNVIGTLEGTTHPEEIIVVGAHYDSIPDSPAANDNGSGVAATLELARMLAARPHARTIRFVGFVNEEPPYFQSDLMGSLVYARACRAAGDDIHGMLSLETIGYYSDAPGSQKYPFPFSLAYPSRGDFIGFVGNTDSGDLVRRTVGLFRQSARFPSESAVAPDIFQGIGWSDHWSFWQAGYPALMVTDTAPFRYPYYHTPEDTPDKLDYDRMARVVDGLTATVAGLADAAR